ncbi:hypothetical protein [Fischerella thermalis]|jgi:hypothetical protein|uniref:hypothetical protein n=1 Tax=Fischerella thermalis TaxID=372787 RepID=UPI003F687796
MSETALTAPDVTLPPTQAELPYDDGEPMEESQRHKLQMDLCYYKQHAIFCKQE